MDLLAVWHTEREVTGLTGSVAHGEASHWQCGTQRGKSLAVWHTEREVTGLTGSATQGEMCY